MNTRQQIRDAARALRHPDATLEEVEAAEQLLLDVVREGSLANARDAAFAILNDGREFPRKRLFDFPLPGTPDYEDFVYGRDHAGVYAGT